MKIISLQISNIWSFKFYENIDEAPKIIFDENFNILIGQNGAGKSTVLEVINFIFKRILFKPYRRNYNLYTARDVQPEGNRKTILGRHENTDSFREFHLEPNYDFEERPQLIRLTVKLDEIDKLNLALLETNKTTLLPLIRKYSSEIELVLGEISGQYTIDISLNAANKNYSIQTIDDLGFQYLTRYNFFKEVIQVHNLENPQNLLPNLKETFALIGSYRNYSSYSPSVSIGSSDANNQIQQHKTGELFKSTAAVENSEPAIFSLVRLQMAKACYDAIDNLTLSQSEETANTLPFITEINKIISIVNLKILIKLTDKSTWSFSFHFLDLKRNQVIIDINSLSAGQKAIIQLVFESFGRDELSGGVVIIDEPEIHLHYQFQNEYLRIIERLNQVQKSQYILVTHSESLINSRTINNVIRLSIDTAGYTNVNQPRIDTEAKWLVKILDNQRSSQVFFGSKVILVEGEDDAYFFNAVLNYIEGKLKRGFLQSVSVVLIGGKKSSAWKSFFDSFGLRTYRILDFDAVCSEFYSEHSSTKIDNLDKLNAFLSTHSDAISQIESKYVEGTYILQRGELEMYIGVRGLNQIIHFCEEDLEPFLSTKSSPHVLELRRNIAAILEIGEEDF